MLYIQRGTRFKIKLSHDNRLQPGDIGVAQSSPGDKGWFMADFPDKGAILVHISQVARP